MLDNASGTDTPAATKVNPMTVSGMPNVLPEKVEQIYVLQFSSDQTLWMLTYDCNHPNHDV